MVDGAEGSSEADANWHPELQQPVQAGEEEGGGVMGTHQRGIAEAKYRTPLRSVAEIANARIAGTDVRSSSSRHEGVLISAETSEKLSDQHNKNKDGNTPETQLKESEIIDNELKSARNRIKQLTGKELSQEELLVRTYSKVEDYNAKLDEREMVNNDMSLRQWIIMLAISSVVEELLGLR